MGRREKGQAAVETALTMPMMLFTLLGILQLTLAYHARILAEYAAFKVARAGSVYRVDCKRMVPAGLMALLPSMSYSDHGAKACLDVKTNFCEDANNDMGALLKSSADHVLDNLNRTTFDSPILWISWKLDPPLSGPDFDKQLTGGEKPTLLHVRLRYFFTYRIPFANWIMVRSWLATQTGFDWAQSDGSDPTMMVKKAKHPPVNKTVDQELLDQVLINMQTHGVYTAPIVSTWSMRLMSNPLPGQGDEGECPH